MATSVQIILAVAEAGALVRYPLSEDPRPQERDFIDAEIFCAMMETYTTLLGENNAARRRSTPAEPGTVSADAGAEGAATDQKGKSADG